MTKFGGGQGIEFARVYSDFKEWNGRLFAGREEQYARGCHTGYSVNDKVEFLDPAGPETFCSSSMRAGENLIYINAQTPPVGHK